MGLGINSEQWKRWVRGALIAVAALDLILLVVRVRLHVAASQAQLTSRVELLRAEKKRVEANLDEAETIRRKLPQIERDCDRFLTADLLGSSTGYSDVVADLGAVAKRSGLRASGIRFQQKDLPKRGVSEVGVTTVVEGDYPSLVRFINGLERSKNFYLLDSLALASGPGTGNIRLNVSLRTYFRL